MRSHGCFAVQNCGVISVPACEAACLICGIVRSRNRPPLGPWWPQPWHHTRIRVDVQVVCLNARQVVLEEVTQEVDHEAPMRLVPHSDEALISGVTALGSPINTIEP